MRIKIRNSSFPVVDDWSCVPTIGMIRNIVENSLFFSSFIYEIHKQSCSPWVYGDELGELYDLVISVVQTWIWVGYQTLLDGGV
jgi:hypothetical protein